MLSLWNEIQELQGKIGQVEVKTFGSVSGTGTSVTLSFIPNKIYVIGIGTGERNGSSGAGNGQYVLNSGLISNGDNVNCSMFWSHKDNNYVAVSALSVTLKDNVVTLKDTGPVKSKIEKGLIIAL